MRMACGIQRLRQVARRITDAFASRALILMYHRVAVLPSDPQLLCVAPRHFREHLEVIRKYARPVRLSHLVNGLRNRRLPGRVVVVTFDDGYADNLYTAKPLLEQQEVPATVFVTAGYVGERREFWWDELERVLLQPGTLPTRLHLSINGSDYQWDIGGVSIYTSEDYERYRHWDVEQRHDPGPRQRIYLALYQLLHSLSEGPRRRLLDQLVVWAGAGSLGRATHRTLAPQEVVHLDEGGLLEVGAHTMNHPVLAALSAPEQRDEIHRSKIYLEEVLGHPVTSFAYPHGSSTAETVGIVREANFECACSSDADVVRSGSDCFQLPRIVVRDWDGDRFAREIRGWLGG